MESEKRGPRPHICIEECPHSCKSGAEGHHGIVDAKDASAINLHLQLRVVVAGRYVRSIQ